MMIRHIFLSLSVLALTTVLLSSAAIAQPPVGDLLLYYDHDREPSSITAYNPATGEKLELPVTNEIERIRTSGDGRIAYLQDNDVWVLDVLNAPYNPINITQTPGEQESLGDWTPDGHLLHYWVGSDPGPYLLYNYDGAETIAVDFGYPMGGLWPERGWYVVSHDGNTDAMNWHVWNGQERIDLALPILPAEPAWRKIKWTPDNHLFITVGYKEQKYMEPVGPTDVFYWNGNDVRTVENPSEDETFMLGDWSADGRLTLYTSGDHVAQWYIWDGVSFTPDGIPDTSTLTAINGPNDRIRDIDWLPDGRLVLVAEGDPKSDTILGHPHSCSERCPVQAYLWIPQTLQLITETDSSGLLVDVHDNGSMTISYFDGGFWGVDVYDSNLQPVFQSGGPYSHSRWSADGNLAYCHYDNLHVWNSHDASSPLSRRTFARWLIAPSRPMLCSTG